MQEYCCHWAKSLGSLEATHQEIWGTKDYIYKEDRFKPAVFFGMYDLRDYLALWAHRGKRYVLWAGSDIENLLSGFIFNDGKLKWLSKAFVLTGGFGKFVARLNAIHYVENQAEASKLLRFGIKAKIVPSFLGDINLPICYKWNKRPQVYVSTGKNRQLEYGFGIIERIANEVPEVTFHLYGDKWETRHKNVVVHGRVPKETMNSQIKVMQCGLRLNKTDGFSEVTAKSVLMGQYPITFIKSPKIDNFWNEDELIELLKKLKDKKKPNVEARNYYREKLNDYPWSSKKHK